ncbi:MAG: putative ribose/galactose isomerase [Rickettsiaceae bacterium]|jgi:ribose 5-phosphate isomerase RpiB|nr:putative ribose/galactose isomerase [Rickettsiaceae bacterium]
MKIALCSDEWHEVKQYVQDWLKKRGFKCVLLGSFVSYQNEPWVESAVKAALSVAAGECSEGIFFCFGYRSFNCC